MEKDPATSVPCTEPGSFSGTQNSSLSTVKAPSEYKTAGTGSLRGPRDKTQKELTDSCDTTEIISPVHRKLCSKSSVSVSNIAVDISHDLQNIQISTPCRHVSTTEDMVVPTYQNPCAAACETRSMRPKISQPQNKETFDIRSSTSSVTGISPYPSSSDSSELKSERRQVKSKSLVTPFTSVSAKSSISVVSERRQMKSKNLVTPFTSISGKSSISIVSQGIASQAKASVSVCTHASQKMNLKPSILVQRSRIHSSSSSSSSDKPFQNEGGNKSDYRSKRGKHPKCSVSTHSTFRSPSEDEYISDGVKTRSSVTHVSGPVQISSDKSTSYGKKTRCSATDAIQMSGKFSSNGEKVKCSFDKAIQLPTDNETNFDSSSKKMVTNKYTLRAKTTKTAAQSTDNAKRAKNSSFNDPIQAQADAKRDKTSISSFSGPVEMLDDVNMNDTDRSKTSVSGPVQMLANVDVHHSEGTKKSVSISSCAFQIPTDAAQSTDNAKRAKNSSFNDPIQAQSNAKRDKTSISSFSGPVEMLDDVNMNDTDRSKTSVSGPVQMLANVDVHHSEGTKKSVSISSCAFQIPTDAAQSTDNAKRAKNSSFNDPIQAQSNAKRDKTSISSFSGPVEMLDDVNMNDTDRSKTSVSGPVQMLANVDVHHSEGTKKSVSISSCAFQIPTDAAQSTDNAKRAKNSSFNDPIQAQADAKRAKTSISSFSAPVEMLDVNMNDTDRSKTSVSGPVQMLANVDVHHSEGTKKSVSISSCAFQIPTDGHISDAHITESSVTSRDGHRSVDVHKSDTIKTNLLVASHVDPVQSMGDVNGTRNSISSFTSSTSGHVQTAVDEYLPEIDKSKNLVSLPSVPIQTHVAIPSKLDRSTESQERSDFEEEDKSSTIIESVGDAGNKRQNSISITKRPSPAIEKAADGVISKQRSVKSSAVVTESHRMEDDDASFLQKPPSKRKAPSKSANKPTESEQDHDVDESSLFHLMCADTLSVQTIVADWVESYKENRHKALLVLLQFVLDAAGCKGKITSDMLQPVDGEQIVEVMSTKLDKNTVEKIGLQFVRSDRKWKSFSLNLELFIQLLVKLCQNSIIYDQFLLDNLTNLLLAMTTSLVRVFRYIGSFIALKLMTALLDLNETVKTNINHTLRQIDVARSSVKHNSERLEVLMDKEQELQENLDELEQVFSFYYKAVFKERYRDVAPLIRSMCIVELGEWLKKVPEKFVHDAHLRYVGWLMQDTMGDVRLSCLQVLHAVYKVQTLKEKLITFTCKFKERLLLMTLDKRIDVSILAIEIYGFIYKFFPEFREEKDLQHMYDLMFSKHRTIAHAAGIFITNTVSQLPCQLSEKSKHGKPWLPNTLFLYKMVRIFVESKMEKYEAYLVDSLIETNEALKDWECMTDLLLEEPDNETDALSDLEENSLISILLCCIQQSVSRVGPPGRETSAKMLSRKERKQMHDDKINITEHFIEKLPMLLTKYETDAENLQRLLSIPQYLELDMYTTPRKEQYLDKLLDKLRTITERHHSKEVLESCIKTLDALCSLSSSTSLRGTVTCKRIIDTILAKYKDAREQFQSSIDADELPSEDQVYTMICCARKVATFYDHFDLSGWHVWGDFFPVIQQVTEGNTLIPEEMIQHCITACYFSLLWDLRETEKPDKQDGAVMNKVKALRSHLEMLINHLSKLLGMSLKNCKEEAYITICDLLIIFKEGGYQYLGKFSGLEYSPSRDLQLELLQIVEEYVFSEENKAAQSVNHCNMLACFIKLFLYNVIPVKAAANILVHYNEPSSNYGELMKEALDKLLVKNRKNCSYVVILALKIAFTKLLNSEVDIHHNKQGYSNLLELATNLSKVFEEDIIKNREAIVNLHIAGINVALEPLQECDQVPQTPPDSLIFLKILTEVTHILLPQDGRSIVKYLDQEIASLHITNQGRDWPLQTYRNTLLHLKTKKPIQPPATRKGRSEKRNITESGSEEERDARRQAELTITNETDGRLHPRSSKTTPSSRHRDSLVRKRRLPVKVIRHPSGQLRHQRSLPESPLLTISDIPEISGTLIHPSSTPYIQH